jgi:hypothetical protein
MGCSKNTVKQALRSDGAPWYERAPRGSMVDEVEPRIRELLRAWPTMPATVIAERIGWQHSIRILRDRVSDLRPAYLPRDPASRTTYLPGELAQCDFWFPEVNLPVGFGQTRSPMQLPVLVMASGYSRPACDPCDLTNASLETQLQWARNPSTWKAVARTAGAWQ